MTQTSKRDRAADIALSIALGGVVALAMGVGRNWALGAIGGLVVAAFSIYLTVGRSEWAVAQGGRADERQTDINREATALAYYAVIAVALAGFLWEMASGQGAGPFTLVCAVGGFTHMISIAVLRRRR